MKARTRRKKTTRATALAIHIIAMKMMTTKKTEMRTINPSGKVRTTDRHHKGIHLAKNAK